MGMKMTEKKLETLKKLIKKTIFLGPSKFFTIFEYISKVFLEHFTLYYCTKIILTFIQKISEKIAVKVKM